MQRNWKMDLLEELKKICEKLDQNNIEYALCGGLALAVYAKPRATLDIEYLKSISDED